MVILYSGVQGSGKSYRMVADLLRHAGKKFIIHNIDGLKPEVLQGMGFDFLVYCRENRLEVTEFFSRDYQEKLCAEVVAKYGAGVTVLVIIDEAAEWFDRQVKALKLWLQYHRHFGQEVWLVAHGRNNIPSVYRSCIEVEYRAKTGSFIHLPGYFLYQRISGGVPCGYIFEKKKKEVFSAYKSQVIGAPVVHRSLLIPVLLILCIVGALLFLNLPRFLYGKKASASDELKKKVSSAAVPVSAAGDSNHAEVEKSLPEKYAYVGRVAGADYLENRETGQQVQLVRLPGRFVVVENSGVNYIRVYDVLNRRDLVFSNIDRYAGSGAERSGSAAPRSLLSGGVKK